MKDRDFSELKVPDCTGIPIKCIDDADITKELQEINCIINELDNLIAKKKEGISPDHKYIKRQEENYQRKRILEEKLREYPLPPVLPPPDNPIKITGVIDELEVIFAKSCFHLGAYENMEYEISRKQLQDAQGKAFAQVMSLASGSSALNSVNEDFCERTPAWYLKGKIDGAPFSGWFVNVNIAIGDKVEMAVAKQERYYLAYGIVNLNDKTIILPPNCYSKEKQLRYWIYMVPFALFMTPFAVMALINQPYNLGTQLLGMVFIVVSMGLVIRHVATKNKNQFWNLYEWVNLVLNIEEYKICKNRKK